MKQVIVKDTRQGTKRLYSNASEASKALGISRQAMAQALDKGHKIQGKYIVERLTNHTKRLTNEVDKSSEVDKSLDKTEKSLDKQVDKSREVDFSDEMSEQQKKEAHATLTPTAELQEQKAPMIRMTNQKTKTVSKHFLADLEYLLGCDSETAKRALDGEIIDDYLVEEIPFDPKYDVAHQKEV